MLGNVYIDFVAISQGGLLLVFAVLSVLISEYTAYRVLCPKQSVLRAVAATIYANGVSVVVGLPIIDPLFDVIYKIYRGIFGGFYEAYIEAVLLFACFVLTWLIEGAALFFCRKKLRVDKVFRTAGIINLVSYVILGIMSVIVNIAASS